MPPPTPSLSPLSAPEPDCCLIFNPAARGQRAALLRDTLTTLSSHCKLMATDAAGAARRLAAEAVAQGFRTILAAGGDGTINEVVNGLADAPHSLPQVRLGILPAGTANAFAKDLGIPLDPAGAWKVVLGGHERRIDLPFAEFQQNGRAVRRHFIQLAGAGFDARAIELVDWERKKRWGALAYVLSGLEALFEPRPAITVSDGLTAARGQLILIGNGRYYAGRFSLFPGARMDDGRLDILVFPKVSLGALLQAGGAWLAGRLHTAAGAIPLQCEAFTVRGEDVAGFELDGEHVGWLPARFGLLPKALRVLVPA